MTFGSYFVTIKKAKQCIYLFQTYKEDQVRLLSKNWLEIEARVRLLVKILSDYGSFNSPQHQAYWAIILLDEKKKIIVFDYNKYKYLKTGFS